MHENIILCTCVSKQAICQPYSVTRLRHTSNYLQTEPIK